MGCRNRRLGHRDGVERPALSEMLFGYALLPPKRTEAYCRHACQPTHQGWGILQSAFSGRKVGLLRLAFANIGRLSIQEVDSLTELQRGGHAHGLQRTKFTVIGRIRLQSDTDLRCPPVTAPYVPPSREVLFGDIYEGMPSVHVEERPLRVARFFKESGGRETWGVHTIRRTRRRTTCPGFMGSSLT
jgi:hypothetical protein